MAFCGGARGKAEGGNEMNRELFPSLKILKNAYPIVVIHLLSELLVTRQQNGIRCIRSSQICRVIKSILMFFHPGKTLLDHRLRTVNHVDLKIEEQLHLLARLVG
jgi:hypothetical protein